jgi:prolyl-tRNA synthetase
MSQKKLDAITDMNQDFAQWYTDVVKKAELIEYSPVKGCLIFRPYGYRIWELIQETLDKKFKQTGVQNVYMPMFIPESLFQKEKDHIEGFAPETATVTRVGNEELAEPLIVRPTSETIFCDHFSNIVQSYRDLPLLYNQWCSVVRWEKTTRPFLRTTEFLWQEGHTVHATKEEAQERAKQMLEVYADLFENTFAIPVIKGHKTEKEKFAGAVTTYTIESLMHDGKALQSGTSHYLGDGFSKAFEINYTDENNVLQNVHQTSWGVSTRMMGSLIMVHGDNNGLMLPPKIAPNQLVVIPIAQKKEGVIERATALENQLSQYFRTKIDITDKSPGWKFSEYEMKGTPLRIELGPKDIEQNQAVLARRDNGEKITVSLDNIVEEVQKMLDAIQINMLEQARTKLQQKTYKATNMEEFEKTLNETPGFIKAMWCGELKCEEEIKQKTTATTRCIPKEQEVISDVCVCCGNKAKEMVYFAKAY